MTAAPTARNQAAMTGLTLVLLPGCVWADVCGGDLVDELNAYRSERGLEPIAASSALQSVAEAHIADLRGGDAVHGECNLHSWSDEGDWSACCYTDDHAEADCMWSKPGEIAGYPGDGYEIAAESGTCMSAAGALHQWIGSEPHHAVIVNEGIWSDSDWQAIGAAVGGGYAVAWFGEEEDPSATEGRTTP